MNLLSPYTAYGTWWFPSARPKKFRGAIEFDPVDGLYLTLETMMVDLGELPIGLGVLEDGTLVTLQDLFIKQRAHNRTVFRVNVLYRGEHFRNKSSIRFHAVLFSCTYLSDWVNRSGFKIDIEMAKSSASIKYQKPKPISLAVVDGLDIKVVFASSGPEQSIVQKEATIKQDALFSLEPKTAKEYNPYFQERIYHLTNFLTLAVNRRAFPREITGYRKAMRRGQAFEYQVDICYPLWDPQASLKRIFPDDMLFTYNDIAKQSHMLIARWLQSADDIGPVFDLYFGTIANRDLFLENRFLSYTQAAETLHRRLHGGEYEPSAVYRDNLYKTLMGSIPASTSDDFKQSLKGRLKYANEYSLRKRLTLLLDQCGPSISSFISNRGAFVGDVVATRNFLTHYTEELRPDAKLGKDLFSLTQQLKYLLEIALLKHLNFPDNLIFQAVSRQAPLG